MTTSFELTKKTASFASDLDDDKNELLPADKIIAAWLVYQLHSFAEDLAGSRAGEIYCADDEVTT